MDARRMYFAACSAVIAGSVAMLLAGCKSKPAATDDTSLNAQVQSRLSADQNLSGQTIQASVSAGVVTLNGSVTSDTARSIAAGDVAQITGAAAATAASNGATVLRSRSSGARLRKACSASRPSA